MKRAFRRSFAAPFQQGRPKEPTLNDPYEESLLEPLPLEEQFEVTDMLPLSPHLLHSIGASKGARER